MIFDPETTRRAFFFFVVSCVLTTRRCGEGEEEEVKEKKERDEDEEGVEDQAWLRRFYLAGSGCEDSDATVDVVWQLSTGQHGELGETVSVPLRVTR